MTVEAERPVLVRRELFAGKTNVTSGTSEAFRVVSIVPVGYATRFYRLEAFHAFTGDISLEAVFAMHCTISLNKTFCSYVSSTRGALETCLVVLFPSVLHTPGACFEFLAAFVTLGCELVVIARDADELPISVCEAGVS